MKRSAIKPKRKNPRRREAPRWSWEEWQAAGQVLLSRSGGGCERCEATWGPLERHHRKRRRDGGDRLSNILMLCRPCHHWVTEHPAEGRKSGFIVSMARDPEEVPVLWRRREWMRLWDTGEIEPVFSMPADGDAHDVWA